VFGPDYAPEEIKEIVQKLRKQAGLPDRPTGEVANGKGASRTTAKRSRPSSRPRAGAKS
jgi:hypothetical protein